jgi:pimeloyl-ACP methyl ester carboxylesterase
VGGTAAVTFARPAGLILAFDRVRQAGHWHVRSGGESSIDGRTDGRHSGGHGRGGLAAGLVFGISEGGTLSLLFARAHPERTRSVVLYGSWARRLAGPDYPIGPSAEELDDIIAGMDRAWASGEWWDGGQPSAADDARHRRWWARYLRTAASPAMAQNVIRMNMRMDIRDLLPTITQPTLVLHRAGDTWIHVGHARYLAEHLPAATYVELSGTDHRPWLGDVDGAQEPTSSSFEHRRRCAEPSRARSGRPHRPRPDRE